MESLLLWCRGQPSYIQKFRPTNLLDITILIQCPFYCLELILNCVKKVVLKEIRARCLVMNPEFSKQLKIHKQMVEIDH